MSVPTNFIDLTRSDPVLAALRALRDEYRSGFITRAQYVASFDQLNRGVGQPCDACLVNVAHVRRGAVVLCAECDLRERGLR
jgi:hypothetical protein